MSVRSCLNTFVYMCGNDFPFSHQQKILCWYMLFFKTQHAGFFWTCWNLNSAIMKCHKLNSSMLKEKLNSSMLKTKHDIQPSMLKVLKNMACWKSMYWTQHVERCKNSKTACWKQTKQHIQTAADQKACSRKIQHDGIIQSMLKNTACARTEVFADNLYCASQNSGFKGRV